MRFVGDLHGSLNRAGGLCLAVFVDIVKAFDSVRHSVLLEKMELAGIRGVPLAWFESYLGGREQRVRLRPGIVSSPTICEVGVPQGSILGPLLFLKYVNDLLELSLHGEVTAYADDVALSYSGGSIAQIMGNAESDLNIIRQWMNSHGMELSGKTEFMGFGAAAARIGNSHLTCHSRDCGEACALNCIKIAAVTHFRYLGITVDSGLTWGRHINGVSTSLRSLSFQLYKMRGACSESLMRCYYFALGESRLRYGLLCWGGACAAHLKPVILAQKRVIRTICYLRKRQSTHSSFQRLEILPLNSLYVYRITDVFFRRGGYHACYFRETRPSSRDFLCVPPPRTQLYKRSPNYMLPIVINNVKRKIQIFTKAQLRAWLHCVDRRDVADLMVSVYAR
ncbi:hypothetical protein DMENIID0001_076820 [Sergentomyia squamirostris]